MSRNCVVRSGDALNLDDSDAQSEQFLANCLTEPGARLRLTLPSETAKMPDITSHAAAPAAPAAKRAPAVDQHEVTSPESTEALSLESAAPAVPAAVEAPAASEELHATTQAAAEPANAAPDLSQIQGLAGGNPIVTVILALIVVGGGTAGWKFWQKKSEQNHELAMKKVDMELELAGLSGAQPPWGSPLGGPAATRGVPRVGARGRAPFQSPAALSVFRCASAGVGRRRPAGTEGPSPTRPAPRPSGHLT